MVEKSFGTLLFWAWNMSVILLVTFYEVSEVNRFQQRKKRKHTRLDFCCCYMLFFSLKKNGLHFINTLVVLALILYQTGLSNKVVQHNMKENIIIPAASLAASLRTTEVIESIYIGYIHLSLAVRPLSCLCHLFVLQNSGQVFYLVWFIFSIYMLWRKTKTDRWAWRQMCAKNLFSARVTRMSMCERRPLAQQRRTRNSKWDTQPLGYRHTLGHVMAFGHFLQYAVSVLIDCCPALILSVTGRKQGKRERWWLWWLWKKYAMQKDRQLLFESRQYTV